MTPIERANTYLPIPPSYRVHLGGLRWSPAHDAILDSAGNTFALTEEVVQVLEGVFARSPVPAFAYVLVAFHRMKRGLDDLAVAYGRARPAPALARNAGLLIAELCGEMPVAMDPPSVDDIRLALDPRHRTARNETPRTVVVPTISPATIEKMLDSALAKHTPKMLAAWLEYGGPTPTAVGEQLAEPVESLPLRIGKLLAMARTRPRLTGAAWLTPALDAALTFPPRRPKANAVPLGGYADVATRGHPERLLLSQFALDSDEFVRRFAERELLYFRPEEPHVPRPPDRVLVLDQGVRTWGAVRLALAGCTLVLLAKPSRAAGRVHFVHTAAQDAVDLTAATPETLAEALQASDLTATPADAVRTAVALPADGPRDVILLTHPRNLGEPRVIAALKACPATDRAFTVAVDEDGRAEIHAWGDRGPVAVRSFRVDLAGAERAGVKPSPLATSTGPTWVGDVEPITFAFRPGVVAEPAMFGFDGPGEWLVAAAKDGVLQAFTLGDEPPEVLPRPFRDGVVMDAVEAILGVTDGVVVCGRMALANPSALTFAQTVTLGGNQPVVLSSATDLEPVRSTWYVVAHYDRARRLVTLHPLYKADRTVRWCVNAARDEVGICPMPVRHGEVGTDVHLGTHQRHERPRLTDWTSRTEAPPYRLPVWTRTSTDESFRCQPYLYLEGSGFEVRLIEPAWLRHEPMRDGQPLLNGTMIESAYLAGNVLTLGTFCKGERRTLVFHGPDAHLRYDLPRGEPGLSTALSPDGRLLAVKTRITDVSVLETTRSGLPRLVATTARLHNSLLIDLQGRPFPLVIRVGEFTHTFTLNAAGLAHDFQLRQFAKPRRTPAAQAAYDPARFPPKFQTQSGGWSAVFDRLGQVVLLDGAMPVAAFLIRRERAAACGHGGIRWGDPVLLGTPPTPHAAQEFAKLFDRGESCP
ncbi:hypothetical protein [Limnoglobus roseus]|uniref:Uncharacterized protein n=1 Tax=Limnoglobus roseus TaxID=2598579 RepID=A0A5C1ANB3_9BACT|nr:hypothetical protein [Limnoglobus roseus]QEL19627.1 hypothetical protein PX52LOC_06703 [Limnoglobus roseus]